jgi:ATP-dependent DNA helicase RecQ
LSHDGRVADAKLGQEALLLLRKLTGDAESEFRPDQLDVIERLVRDRQRLLLVERTGWGKSAVYFIATRMLRDRGAGPTLLVSPLLALMRNQIDAAERMGVGAATINSANRADWDAIEAQLESGAIDILLISPERLANAKFRADVLPEVGRRSGLLVIDEAHCISDWGHDFRPDYRRLVRVLDLLPAGVPVLCCTATANDRVIADITVQLGSGLAPLRGPLGRDGLRLQVVDLPRQAERMAWLADVIPRLVGTGIVYCLTIADTERLSGWLRSRGIDAVAYSGATDPALRPVIEQRLLANELKVVVATSALGMGFDKPDLSFVVHYQAPGSPIAYYQQVGRAGRALPLSFGVLMRGREDVDIQDHFIRSAFPPAALAERVIGLLAERAVPMSTAELLDVVNIRPAQLELLLKVLEVEGAIERDGNRWLRTLRDWSFDHLRVEAVTALRRTEQAEMAHYATSVGCRMRQLRGYLDDGEAAPCGICDNCSGEALVADLDRAVVQQAVEYLRSDERLIGPRLRLPDRSTIASDRMLQTGRSLAEWGDGGWGDLIRRGKHVDGRFDDHLVTAAAELIRGRWRPDPPPAWVTFVPSRRHPELVPDLARRLAAALGLPCEDVVVRVRDTERQKLMQNSPQQYGNVRGAFEIRGSVSGEPVLLVDDIVDSRWTLTAVGWKLLEAGSGPVHPFALTDTAGRSVT